MCIDIFHTRNTCIHITEGMFVGRGENNAPRRRAQRTILRARKKRGAENREREKKKPTYEMHNEREMDSEILCIIR